MNKRSQVSILCKIEAEQTHHLKTHASSACMCRLNHTQHIKMSIQARDVMSETYIERNVGHILYPVHSFHKDYYCLETVPLFLHNTVPVPNGKILSH